MYNVGRVVFFSGDLPNGCPVKLPAILLRHVRMGALIIASNRQLVSYRIF